MHSLVTIYLDIFSIPQPETNWYNGKVFFPKLLLVVRENPNIFNFPVTCRALRKRIHVTCLLRV